jgi:4-hydroxy-2-oxoheptanedioate aldolase
VLADVARRISEVCHRHKIVVGNPHTHANNVERLLGEGYRFLMSAPTRAYGVVGQGRELAGY